MRAWPTRDCRCCRTTWSRPCMRSRRSGSRNSRADSMTIDLAESEEIAALRDTLRRFVAKECPPEAARKWDRDDLIPRAMTRKLSELDIYGLCVPEEYGGMGRRVTAMTVAMEELARGSMALAGLYVM